MTLEDQEIVRGIICQALEAFFSKAPQSAEPFVRSDRQRRTDEMFQRRAANDLKRQERMVK